MFFGFGRGAGQPGRQYTRVVTTPTKKRPAKRESRLWIAFTQAAFSRSMPEIYSDTDEELAVFGHGCSVRSEAESQGEGGSGGTGESARSAAGAPPRPMRSAIGICAARTSATRAGTGNPHSSAPRVTYVRSTDRANDFSLSRFVTDSTRTSAIFFVGRMSAHAPTKPVSSSAARIAFSIRVFRSMFV